MSIVNKINVSGTEYDIRDNRVRFEDGADFDYGTLVQGGINNTNGYTTGRVLRRSETYWPVIEGPVNIVMSNGLTGYIRLYDSSRTMIDPGEGMPGSDTTNHVLVIAKNATLTLTMKEYNPNTAYFRFYFSCGSEEYVSALVRENARIVPLQTVVTPDDLQDVAGDVTALEEDVSDLKSAIDNVVIHHASNNILDPSIDCISGYVNPSTGNMTESDGYITTDFIPVTGDMYLVWSKKDGLAENIRFIAEYDSEKNLIKAPGQVTEGTGAGTHYLSWWLLLKPDTKYVKLSVSVTYNLALRMVSLENTATKPEYADYYNPYDTINGDLLIDTLNEIRDEIAGHPVTSSPLFGKKVSWYGDSIIGNRWWASISELFAMESTNNGVGGSKISGTQAESMCQTTRIEGEYTDTVDPITGETTTGGVAIPTDADFIIIGAGTNDWAQNVPLGDRNVQYDAQYQVVEDVTTFYQACHVMFRRLEQLRPNAKVIVLGTPFAKMQNRGRFTNKYGVLNNEGLSALDYGNALCDAAEMWGHITFRYGNHMQINDGNVATYLDPANADSHVHPTVEAGKDLFRKAALNGLMGIRYI